MLKNILIIIFNLGNKAIQYWLIVINKRIIIKIWFY